MRKTPFFHGARPYANPKGARKAYADAKARGEYEDAENIKNFVLELKKLGLWEDDDNKGKA